MKRRVDSATIRFDIFYEDGGRASNRKIPANLIGGLDGDDPAKAFFESEDMKIAERSGQPPRPIKSIVRSAG